MRRNRLTVRLIHALAPIRDPNRRLALLASWISLERLEEIVTFQEERSKRDLPERTA